MSLPCPNCGRLYTFDGNRCCNRFCRYGSRESPEIDFTALRREKFLTEGGRAATAAWVPAWYELDPPLLAVGQTAEFAFWREVPDELRGAETLVLYSGTGGERFGVAWGTIAAIRHPDLGAIRSISTRGLDYTIILQDTKQLLVNAEENPGRLFESCAEKWVESQRCITGWRFIVDFSALADRVPPEAE